MAHRELDFLAAVQMVPWRPVTPCSRLAAPLALLYTIYQQVIVDHILPRFDWRRALLIFSSSPS